MPNINKYKYDYYDDLCLRVARVHIGIHGVSISEVPGLTLDLVNVQYLTFVSGLVVCDTFVVSDFHNIAFVSFFKIRAILLSNVILSLLYLGCIYISFVIYKNAKQLI